MKPETNTLFIANPANIVTELDSDQFDLVYFDVPPFEINISKSNDNPLIFENFEEYLEYIVGLVLESQRLLRETGSILVRVDPSSLFNAKLFLDRVFGKENFRAEIVWERAPSKRRTISSFPNMNFENLFLYSKSERFIYHEPTREVSKAELQKTYKHKDAKGYYKLWTLVDKTDRTNKSFEWKGFTPPKGSYWRYTANRLNELDALGEIEFGGKFPRRKVYLSEEDTRLPLGFVWNNYPPTDLKQFPVDPRIKTAIQMVTERASNILFLFADMVMANTIQELNTENATHCSWVGVSPVDIVKQLHFRESEIDLFLPKSRYNIKSDIRVVRQVEKQGKAAYSDFPAHIRRVIKGEAQTILLSSLPKSMGQRYAFLVGINHYTSDIGNLNYCVNDVVVLGQTFQNLGYVVKILHDDLDDSDLSPNKSNIETELIDLINVLSPEDTLYVHFSCHGTLVEDKALLIANDTRRKRLLQTALDLQGVIDTMKSARAKKLVLSLDVCHGGVNTGRALVDAEFVQNVYEKAEGFALLAASTALQQAYEIHEHRHGLFTHFLIRGLSGDADLNDDGIISVSELKDYLLDQIRRWNLQHGGVQTPTYRAEGIGDIPLVLQ